MNLKRQLKNFIINALTKMIRIFLCSCMECNETLMNKGFQANEDLYVFIKLRKKTTVQSLLFLVYILERIRSCGMVVSVMEN